MKTKHICGLALKALGVVTLAASINACVLLVPDRGVHAKPAQGGDVVVCHKGKKTMTLPRSAAASHMEHGDRYGSC